MRMIKKTSWLVAGRVIGDGLSFGFYLLIARTFGERGVGDYSFAFAVAALLILGVEFGLRPLVTRSVARSPQLARESALSILAAQLVLTLIMGGVLGALILVAGYRSEVSWLLLLAFGGLAFRALAITLVAFLEAVEAMDKSALAEVSSRTVIAVVGIALILAGASLQAVMVAHVVGGAAYLGVTAVWVVRRFGLPVARVDPALAIRIFRSALPFVGAATLYEMYARVDILMLHEMLGAAETGQYAVAVRVVTTPVILANLVGQAMYPNLSRAAATADEGRLLFLGTLKWLGITAMAGAVVLITVGDPTLVLLFGAEYGRAGGLVPWLTIVLFVQFVAVAYWRLLFAMDRETTVLKLQAVSVGLNLILNVALIPVLGALGAAVASITTEAGMAIGFHVLCSRIFPARYMANAARLAVTGAAGVGVGLATMDMVAWPIAGVLALLAWFGAALITRLLGPAEWEFLRRNLTSAEGHRESSSKV